MDFKDLMQKLYRILSKEEMGILADFIKSEVCRFGTKTEVYKHLNSIAKKGQILFTGSSLMENFPISELSNEDDFGLKIYNRGIGGFMTKDFIANIDTVLLDLEPQKIFINVGTNDLSDPNLTLENLLQNYAYILQTIHDKLPNAQTYVMAFYPMNQSKGDPNIYGTRTNAKLNEANTELEKLSSGYENCEFINVNEGLCDGNGELREEWTMDGIHLFPEAYKVVYRNLLKYLR